VKRDYAAIAEGYISRVLSGEELVCRKVRLAVERHVNMRRRADEDPAYPYFFDPRGCHRYCRLFELVQPSKWPKRMQMAPWAVCVEYIIYGWKKKANGKRLVKVTYCRWPRKTGKSARNSVKGLYHLEFDGENGAEVYAVALIEEQARRVFDEAVAMRDATPQLTKLIQKSGSNPCRRLLGRASSVFRPLSRDKESMEGLNISYASGDEVHKWAGRGAFDVVRYGMRSREQPLFELITTAPSADDTTSICNSLDDYAEKVLTGAIDDPAFFAWILEIDPEIKNAAGEVVQPADAWNDESKWVKACPNLGITVKIEDMRQEALEASNDAAALNAFKRYSLNIRVESGEQPIPIGDWDACAVPGNPVALREEALKALAGRMCFSALDLALTDDTSALAMLFPPVADGELWKLLTVFWIPADNIGERVEKHQVPYDLWRDQGFLITTPGKVTDYDFVVTDILRLARQFDLVELAYDPALASGLIKKVLDGRPKAGLPGLKKDKVVKFAQNPMNYAAPCGDFVRGIARREIEHYADPVMRWQITNLRWKKNHTGLIMPDKEKSIEKIDGPVASIMAFGRGTHPDNAKLIKAKPKVSTL
jgi:phage terminase large subunit-like protein